MAGPATLGKGESRQVSHNQKVSVSSFEKIKREQQAATWLCTALGMGCRLMRRCPVMLKAVPGQSSVSLSMRELLIQRILCLVAERLITAEWLKRSGAHVQGSPVPVTARCHLFLLPEAPMQRFGGQGQSLLLLHATGFLGAAYEPLAAALAAQYVVYSLDFPGHGKCTAEAPGITALAAANFVVSSVDANGLRGCLAFGHSAGGAFGLLASTLSPGLFSAIYCFEAVASTPETHRFILGAKQSGRLHTAGQILASMARRRRYRFSSKQDAMQRLRQKLPFAAMHPKAMEQFVEFGIRKVTGMSTASLQPMKQSLQHGQQEQAMVELMCDPSLEALYYEALDPPPAVRGWLITCPVMLAVSGAGTGGAYREHGAVQQWILQNPPAAGPATISSGSNVSNSSSGQDPLHGLLVVVNEELAASIPAEYVTIPGVSHFGPLEKPQLIAASCTAFFQQSLRQKTRQSDEQSCRVQSRL